MSASETDKMRPEPIVAGPLAALAGVHHGFFTRTGGVSQGLYASLNCGHGSKDATEAVAENRRRVSGVLLGSAPDEQDVLTVYQVHSATAVVADGPIARGSLPKADAIATRTPGLVLGALSADCAPVLFADPQAHVVAVAHAGWRGALSGITDAAVEAMESLGASRRRIVAVVGPCIGPAAYEVGPEFEADFIARDAAYRRFFLRPREGGRPHFDLPGFVVSRLEKAGLGEVAATGHCTYGDESRFFSFRRTTHAGEPDYGRHISAIVVT